MSISNFCVSESASSRFVEEFESRSIEKGSQLSQKLQGLSGQQLAEESKEILFKLEQYRIDQIEQFFREHPKPELKDSEEDQSAPDDESVTGIQRTEAEQQLRSPTANQANKKRGSMFQIGLNQDNKVNFKRYSAVNDGIGGALQQMKLTALTPRKSNALPTLNSQGADLKEPASESDAQSDCSSDSEVLDEELQEQPEMSRQWQPVVKVHSQNGKVNGTKGTQIDLLQALKAGKAKWQELKGKQPVFVVPVAGRAECSVNIVYNATSSEKPKLESVRSELLDTNAISVNSETAGIDLVVERNRFWCNEVANIREDRDSEFKNDVQLQFSQKTPGQFTLRLETGFFGAFINLPIKSFNSRIALRPGMMFFVNDKRGFVVREAAGLAGFGEDAGSCYWATNLKAQSVGSLKSFLLQKAEIPSCSSSCSSRVKFSFKQSIQSFLKSQVEEPQTKVVVLTKFKFVARHKMFKFEESVCLFEVDSKVKDLQQCFSPKSGELQFGAATVKGLAECGFGGIHPLESLNMDFELKVRLTADGADLSYCHAEGGELIDLFDAEPRKSIAFSATADVSGLFVQTGLFQSGQEFFGQSKEFALSSGTAIRVCNTVYRVEC